MRRTIALAALTAAALGGCGGSSSDHAKVDAAAQSYVAAFTAHDAGATCLALTERSREQVAEFARERLRLPGATCTRAVALLPRSNARARVKDITVHGSRATAAVDGFDRPLTLVREAGTWRVQSSPLGETN